MLKLPPPIWMLIYIMISATNFTHFWRSALEVPLFIFQSHAKPAD